MCEKSILNYLREHQTTQKPLEISLKLKRNNMNIFIASLWVSLVLFLLYNTGAVYQYAKVFPFLNFITHIKEYEKSRLLDNIPYSMYMEYKHNGFLTQLFTCRYCFGFWISLSVSLVIGKVSTLPLLYFASQLIYMGFVFVENYFTSKEIK